jgi:hypothetical protein
MLSTIPHD